MQKRRTFGIVLIVLGLIVLLIKPFTTITGFTVASDVFSEISNVWIYVLSGLMIVSGIILTSQSASAYEERESKLKELIGEGFERLSESDQIAANKSFRKHLDNIKRNVGGEKDLGYQHRIIRTKHFNKAIRGHENEVERTIEKLDRGVGKKEPLKHREGYSIRTTKGGRIIYDVKGSDKIVLMDYTPDHKY
jgi:Txe/YoeB family toxin of Txe-Axe toxin-antitoxin module